MPPLLESLKSGWTRANDNNAGLLAAGIAYYAFLSFMPLLAAVVLTYGLVADPVLVARHIDQLSDALPAAAAELVGGQLESVTDKRSGTSGLGLILALALSLFGARVAAGATITAINIAFGVDNTRGFLKANLLALAITVGAVLAIALVGGATALVALVLDGAGGAFTSFAVIGLAGIGGAALAYRIVPNRDDISFAAAMRGAIPFAVGWMIASAGFGFYTANFGNYDATYGSLGAIVVFLTWMYLSAYLLLIGAHLASASVVDNDR